MDNNKPWTADDIRENASNWSLQADAKLMEFMQSITQNITERGNRTTYNLHKMALDLDETKIALDNATNQLMALQHNQFVENRVYDDDETLTNVENVPTQNEQSQSEMEPTMASALQKILDSKAKIVDKYFVKVSVDLSDSEDDDNDAKNVLLHPRDRYKDRPLPYLIGSKEWCEKWHIGLVETDSDDATVSDNDNEDSISSTPSHSISTNVPGSLSESEPSPRIPSSSRKVVREISPYSSSENLSQVQHESSFDTTDRSNMPKAERSSQPIDPRDFNAINSIFVKQRPVNPTHATPNLIDAEPPALDNETPVARKKPVNLFMDDDDDNISNDFNIFDDAGANVAGKRASNASHSNQAQKRLDERRKNSVNLFNDHDSDDFESMMPSSSKTVSSIIQRKVDSKAITNLFEDDDDNIDDDSDLFLKPAAATASSRSSILSNAPPKKDVFMCNLFDDEPPEDDFDVFRTTGSKTGAGVKVEHAQNVKNPLEFDDFISEKTESDKSNKKVLEESSRSGVNVTDKTTGGNTIKSINLFDDEPPEDDFDVFKSTAKADKPKSQVPENSSESSVHDASKKTDKNEIKSMALFDDKPPEDDFDMFKPSAKLSTEVKTNKPKPIDKLAADDKISIKKADSKVVSKINLFGDDNDDDDDDIFKSMSKTSNQTKAIANKIEEKPKSVSQAKNFWDSDEDAPIDAKSSKSNISPAKPKNPYDAIRLFDDTPPDDDEDLFASKPTKSKPVTVISKAQGEFYNDFSETIVVKPDDVRKNIVEKSIEKEIAKAITENPSKQIQPEQSLPKEASAGQQIQKEPPTKEAKPSAIARKIDFLNKSTKGDDSNSETESASRPQPKKLNMAKIDINVAALLPGAKRTKSTELHSDPAISSESEIENVSNNKSIDAGDAKISTAKAASQDNVDDAGRLTNLNRDRAKVSVKRRPSTRRGRQQQYQKTLDVSESIDSVDNKSVTNIPTNELREENMKSKDDEKEEQRQKHSVIGQNVKLESTKSLEKIFEDKLVIAEPSVQKTLDGTPSDDVQAKVQTEFPPVGVEIDIPPLDDQEKLAPEDTSKHSITNENVEDDGFEIAKQNASKPFLDASIFDDDDDMGNDDFNIFAKKPSEPKLSSKPIKVTPAFIDDLPPELDPVDESTFAVADNQKSAMLSRNALDLFGDDDDDDFDNDNIFSSSQKSSGSKTPVLDESSDLPTSSDNWSTYSPAMASTTNAPSLTSALTNTVFLDKSPPSLGTNQNLSLFGESDSDDDNIFGGSSSTKKSVTKVESIPTSSTSNTPASIKPSTIRTSIDSTHKIFSDDSTDDDLFGGSGGAKKNTSINQQKAETTKATMKSGKSAKLFSDSDDDDDDDLFGGKSKKISVPTKKASAIDTARPTKAAASGETANSNPLSDLLK